MKMIYSTFTEKESMKENIRFFKAYTGYLKKIKRSFKVVKGSYKGVKELSLVTDQNLMTLKLILEARNQESALLLDNENNASLIYINGSKMSLGKLKQVDRTLALTKEGWSRIDGKYFIIE